VFIRRGPWAYLQANRGILPPTAITITSLDELPDAFPRADQPKTEEVVR